MPLEFSREVVVGSHPPFPAQRAPSPGYPAWLSWESKRCTKGSLPEGPAGGTASPPKFASVRARLAGGIHPKMKPRLCSLPSLKVLCFCSRSPCEPGQLCSRQSHQSGSDWRVPLDPSAGHYRSSEKRIQLCLYPACETQNSDCCLGWQKTQSLLPNWPTKLFCNGPKLIHTPHGTVYKGAEGTFV